MLAVYREVEDLIQIGAYAKGARVESDTAVEFIDKINVLLRQSTEESKPGAREKFPAALAAMHQLADEMLQRVSGKVGKK